MSVCLRDRRGPREQQDFRKETTWQKQQRANPSQTPRPRSWSSWGRFLAPSPLRNKLRSALTTSTSSEVELTATRRTIGSRPSASSLRQVSSRNNRARQRYFL